MKPFKRLTTSELSTSPEIQASRRQAELFISVVEGRDRDARGGVRLIAHPMV